jgi:hypothetical protein
MPRRKPKLEKVVQEKIKENLDAIIMEENLDSVKTGTDELPVLKTSVTMDFEGEKQSSATEARTLLDSLVKFYFDSEVISENNYLDYRKKIDSMNVSSMMFQLKSGQHAITKLLEEIDMGNMHPRLFEVLAQLQGQIMQMSKDHQAYLDKMENSYKRMKETVDDKNYRGGIALGDSGSDPHQTGSSAITEDGNLRARGTKGLMEGLRGILGGDIVDVKPVEIENPNAIVNAKQKMKMDPDESEGNSGASNNSPEIEDDLFN